MPWCPNCKEEYQEGYTECNDCKIALVDSLEKAAEIYEPFFQSEDKKIAEKLVKFFEYSDLKCEMIYDDQSELYIITIPPKKSKQARKLYEAFYFVEAERIAKEAKTGTANELSQESKENSDEATSQSAEADEYLDITDEASSTDEDSEEDAPSDDVADYSCNCSNHAYVMKSEQYKDLAGTVWIFLVFGVLGLALVLLNATGVLTIFSGWIPLTIMTVLFIAFIYVALSTHIKAKKIQSEIEAENKLTDEINSWMKLNVTESFLSSIHNDDISEEANYIKETDEIKEMLLKEFSTQNLAYLDRVIDDYFNNSSDLEEFEAKIY